jgi:hypothetical protein
LLAGKKAGISREIPASWGGAPEGDRRYMPVEATDAAGGPRILDFRHPFDVHYILVKVVFYVYSIDIRLALPPAAAVLIETETSSRSQLR